MVMDVLTSVVFCFFVFYKIRRSCELNGHSQRIVNTQSAHSQRIVNMVEILSQRIINMAKTLVNA